jgi:pimeloyl-ACP methyl ester carboxylesterase
MGALEEMNAVHVGAEGPTKGPPLLLLHGIGNGAWVWKRYQQQMAKAGFASWALDLPGHGADTGSNPSLEQIRDLVLRAVEEMEETPCLIGHSMGGLVAQMVATDVALHSMVLMCSAAPKGVRVVPQKNHIGPALVRIIPALIGRHLDFRGAGYREIGFNCVPESEHDALEAQLSPWPNKLAKQLVFRRPEVAPAPCRVLVTCGLQDRLVSFRIARLIGDYHNNAVTWRFDDVGHFPPLEPGGGRLLGAVLDWVQDPQGRRVLEIDAFQPKEGIGGKARKERSPNPERSDSRWKGRFKGRD